MTVHATPPAARLAIVGSFHGTHLAGSLWRAAGQLGLAATKIDQRDAACRIRLLRAAAWRCGIRRPAHLGRFSAAVIARCSQLRPHVLIATGAAPLTVTALRELRALGIVCVNFSTDDPWNPAVRARWHLRALPQYDLVFTTRRANVDDLKRLGCADVRYLPFGYDEWLVQPDQPSPAAPSHDVLFVGGADRDRVAFMTAFMRAGPAVALVGGYWERFRATRHQALGQLPPDRLAALTAAAKVNLCLVRRANRDGHVMRSFEIAAIGGCMLAEDTEEHRQIFGADGECVRYFRTPAEAAERARALLGDAPERRRLACAVRARVVDGGHTYRDRLTTMLRTAACPRGQRPQ
jgi:spore maturation protein CgeB